MDPESKNHLPRILVVAPNPERQAYFINTLTPYFLVSVFRNAEEAMNDCAQDLAEVLLMDQDGPADGNGAAFLDQAEKLEDKSPGLVITMNEGVPPSIDTDAIKVPYRFVTWPFENKTLLDAISNVIGRRAEKAWHKLPERIGRPLTLTVEEYQDIADTIAAGEPVDCTNAAASCQPLVESVAAGAHHELLKAVQSHHNYTYVHSMRVATLLTLFGYGLGLKDRDLLVLSTGGLVHDVGKTVTPHHILDKPGRLTEEEWPTMRNHVVRSAEILGMSDDVTKGAIIIASQHHEKIDGTGYPKGLKGEELNELARMSIIVDIFGALTDARSYKPPFPAEKAFSILEEMTDQIDMNLLKIFRSIFEPGAIAEAA